MSINNKKVFIEIIRVLLSSGFALLIVWALHYFATNYL